MDKYKDFERINLIDLNNFFIPEAIRLLNNLGVNNLSELFRLYDEGNFSSYFPSRYYNHIFCGVKLLRCKFLDVDPLIDVENNDIVNICESLGISRLPYGCLIRQFNILSDNFFDFIKEPDSFEKLSTLRHMVPRNVEEVYERAIIVVNYYDKHKDDKKDIIDENSEKETLESLYAELKRLREENARIDKEIGVILGKIEEKKLSDSKGRGNK